MPQSRADAGYKPGVLPLNYRSEILKLGVCGKNRTYSAEATGLQPAYLSKDSAYIFGGEPGSRTQRPIFNKPTS
jgi:hypothetical protein